jgi:hypothetical protein
MKTILWIREHYEEIKRGLLGGFTIFSLAIIFINSDSTIQYDKDSCLKWNYNQSEDVNVCIDYKISNSDSVPYGSFITK